MPIYNFRAFEVDLDYYGGEDGFVLGESTLSITDDDDQLHSSTDADPGNDQQFSIDGGPFTENYSVEFQDFVVLNGGGTEYEVFAFVLEEDPERYFVFSKDAGFDPTAGDAITVSRFNSFENTDYEDIGSSVCFAAGTRIKTPFGMAKVEHLSCGDMVSTRENGAQPVLWIHKRHFSLAEIDKNPALKPVALKLSASGCEKPLFVSQQHAVSLRNFSKADGPLPDTMIRAKHVAQYFRKHGRVAHGKRMVTYVHFLLPQHDLVWANGLLAESLYLGPQAEGTLGHANLNKARRALRQHHGTMRYILQSFPTDRVRPLLTGREIREVLAGTAHTPTPALMMASPNAPIS